MRSRLLDVVLIVGLVVVAGGIMWTLFNLGSSSPPTTTTAPPSTAPRATSPTAPSITPVSPRADVATPGPTDGAPGDDAASDGAAAPADGAPPADDAAAEAAAPAAPTPPRVVPPGTVALERIGFSYATGGAGACGVVLEPWVHVAVSRDLLAAYGCGAEVTVTLDDPAGGREEVVGVIGDTMNPSFEMTVNVYVGEDEDAFAYGLTTGTFTPR
jgi:hypothetical protein